MKNGVMALAHFVGASLGTLIFIFGLAIIYDTTAPVVPVTIEKVADPSVEPGGVLTVIYETRGAVRPCTTRDPKITITDSRGFETSVEMDSLVITLTSAGYGVVTYPIPDRAELGYAKLSLSYSKVCSIFGLYDSVHRVVRPPLPFTIEPHPNGPSRA